MNYSFKKAFLLNLLISCSIIPMITASDITPIITDPEYLQNQDQQITPDVSDETDENFIEQEGHVITFTLDQSINIENIEIVAEQDQFYFIVTVNGQKIVTIGKTEDLMLTIYSVSIDSDDLEDENAEINATRCSFPLDEAINCEQLQAHFNEETRTLTLFLPFTETSTN